MKNIYRDSDKLDINELIHQIIYFIKNKDDYKSASEIMLNSNITIEELSEKTLKLTEIELAKIADELIKNKR